MERRKWVFRRTWLAGLKLSLGAGNLDWASEALTQHLKRMRLFLPEFGGPARAATGQNSIVVNAGTPCAFCGESRKEYIATFRCFG